MREEMGVLKKPNGEIQMSKEKLEKRNIHEKTPMIKIR